MIPSEYIKLELKSFINSFPKTRVRYENDFKSRIHFIEVVPNEVYHLDENYIDWESKFFDNFINEYPDQNICFISDDAIVGIDNVDFELLGTEFSSLYSIVDDININFDYSINNGTLSLFEEITSNSCDRNSLSSLSANKSNGNIIGITNNIDDLFINSFTFESTNIPAFEYLIPAAA